MSLNRYNARSIAETCCNGQNMDTCPTCGIPNYGQDHNYADYEFYGEDPATYKTNLPALTAAKMSNGQPHPWVVNNGINGNGVGFPFTDTNKSFKTLYGEREDDAYHESYVNPCDVLSSLSEAISGPLGMPKGPSMSTGRKVEDVKKDNGYKYKSISYDNKPGIKETIKLAPGRKYNMSAAY